MTSELAFFLTTMLLWWPATVISRKMKIGAPGQHLPTVGLTLMALTLPAGLGSWTLPIYKIIWGDIAWWKVIICVLGSSIFGNFLTGVLLTRASLILLATPLAVIFSISGLALFLFSEYNAITGISIWHIIILLTPLTLLALSMYGVYLFSRKVPPADTASSGPAGVGGWLLLLTTCMMVLWPIIGIGALHGSFMNTESLNPLIKDTSEWKAYKSLAWLDLAVMSFLCFYAGIGLSRGRNVMMVQRAKAILWIIGPLNVIIAGLAIPMRIFGNEPLEIINQGLMGTFIATIIIASILTAYLSKSKRVKATYGIRAKKEEIPRTSPHHRAELDAQTDHAPKRTLINTSLPDDYEDQVKAVAQQKRELRTRFFDGEFEEEQLHDQMDELDDKLFELRMMKERAELSRQTTQQATVNDFQPPMVKRIQRLENHPVEERTSHNKHRERKGFFKNIMPPAWIIIALGLGLVYLLIESNASTPPLSTESTSVPPRSNNPIQSTPSLTKAEAFAQAHTPVARPANGTTFNFKGREAIAPFAIETSAGADYFIKLKENGIDAYTIFIRGGQNVEVQVPLGNYTMYYASGDTWYGAEHLFGPDTVYSKSNDLFSFQAYGNQISGYTVTLYRVVNGNMETRRISASEF